MSTYDTWKTTDDTDYGDEGMVWCSTCKAWVHEDDECHEELDVDEDTPEALAAWHADRGFDVYAVSV